MKDTVIVDGRTYAQRYASSREVMDAMRPYAATQATLTRWAGELVNWFSVVSPGARVIAWRIGDRYILQTVQEVTQ